QNPQQNYEIDIVENRKQLSAFASSVVQNARNQIQKVEDTEEVKEMINQKNKLENDRKKKKDELEKENLKLKNRSIKIRYEKEDLQTKIRQLEENKFDAQKKTKQLQQNSKYQLNELATLQSRVQKIETDIVNTQIIIKDKEGEIQRLQEKQKLTHKDHENLLRELENVTQKNNIVQFDLQQMKSDKDRIMEELEKRQIEANEKFNQLNYQYLDVQSQINEKNNEIIALENAGHSDKIFLEQLRENNRVLMEKKQDMENNQKKLKKKQKRIEELEVELDFVQREKKIEIVEKIVEKPVVIEKPVIVEKEVIIREQIKVDENLEKELNTLREQLILLESNTKQRESECEYWRKKQQELENAEEIRFIQIQKDYDSQVNNINVLYQNSCQEVSDLQGKLNLLLAEVHQLSNLNIDKNKQISDQINQLLNKNQALENIINSNNNVVKQIF
ncbi:hypothetical protein IMG5_057150, partial [Ichthyophthirius multifiliis]